jgi:hypothetical protein
MKGINGKHVFVGLVIVVIAVVLIFVAPAKQAKIKKSITNLFKKKTPSVKAPPKMPKAPPKMPKAPPKMPKAPPKMPKAPPKMPKAPPKMPKAPPTGVGAGGNNGKGLPTTQEGFSSSFGSPVGQCFSGAEFKS